MAQAGYTPISTYYSATASAVPVNTNLVNGELAINITDGKLYYKDNVNAVQLLASKAGASGDVVGPASSTDNAIARYDLTTGKLIQNSGVTIDDSNNLTLPAQGDVRFADSDSSNWVAFQGPATVASNVTWTLPSADGTSGQFLSTDGAGILSWATASGGGGGGGTSVTVTQITATASQTTFNVTYTVGQISVYLNGALLASADYTATNGTTVVLATGAAANDIFTAVVYSTVTGLTINTASPFNTWVGSSAGAANTTGANNVAVGYQALDANTTGAFNTAVGSIALGANTVGQKNVAVGYWAMEQSTGSQNCVAVGYGALDSTTAGDNNTALGYLTLYANTGDRNTAVGAGALDANTTTSDLTAVGYNALGANTTGIANTAVGSGCLDANTTGQANSALGINALGGNTTGSYNVAFGKNALESNTTADQNTAVGWEALNKNTTGSSNTAVGYGALDANTTGYYNTAVGADALGANTTAIANTAIGFLAGGSITTGESNVLVGHRAGQYPTATTTGLQNIYIGTYAVGSAATNQAELVIGYSATGKGTNTGYIAAGSGGGIYNGGNTTTWTTTSDRRIKKNIVDNNQGIDIISQIRVRNFEYRLPEEIDPELKPQDAVKKIGVQLGVIAQELAEICPDCVKTESTGVMSVNTDDVFWHMVNAVKQLSSQVTALQAEVNQLKGN